jgi:molybdopterin molybdotransferase
MKDFFKVTNLAAVFDYMSRFERVKTEKIQANATLGRILSRDVLADMDLPDFARSTMDGYAVRAASTFGASEGSPAYLSVKGTVSMGDVPDFTVGAGEAVRISTGGMLPDGADGIVMIEHTETLDDGTIEVYRSVAPGQHVITVGEDFRKDETVLSAGQMLRPQEMGLLGAFGKETVPVYKKPRVAIISTGDELVPINQKPAIGQIRDINTYTLCGMVQSAGGIPVPLEIVPDNFKALHDKCTLALEKSDMVLISGGSSVGVRDFTIEVLSKLPHASILVHGISISPGKPTILAEASGKAFWGLPGHVVSAMVVFQVVVRPFLEHVAGLDKSFKRESKIPARLSRNISSAQGRTDFVRVRFITKEDTLWAEPILGKSGLIQTMVKADGLIEIDLNTEGLDKGTAVEVIPF